MHGSLSFASQILFDKVVDRFEEEQDQSAANGYKSQSPAGVSPNSQQSGVLTDDAKRKHFGLIGNHKVDAKNNDCNCNKLAEVEFSVFHDVSLSCKISHLDFNIFIIPYFGFLGK